MQIVSKLIVCFVWLIIFFEMLTYILLYIPMLTSKQPVLTWVIIPLFITVYLLLVMSYGKVICTEPGNPDRIINYTYNSNLDSIKQYAHKSKSDRQNKTYKTSHQQLQQATTTSYCFKCQLVKQVRVHHCRKCDQCIIRMDHHCPWVGHCIGQFNHKFFLLFLLYSTIDLFIVSTNIISHFLVSPTDFEPLSEIVSYILILTAISSALLTLSIGFLLITQIMTTVANLTTLESFSPALQQQRPWDKGSIGSNLKQVLGESCWFLPTQPFPRSLTHEPI